MENCWLVLIGGGHAAGKKVVVNDVTNSLEALATDELPMKIEVIHLKDYHHNDNTNDEDEKKYGGPSFLDLDKLKQDLMNFDKDSTPPHNRVIILEGLYALYDKELRDKAIMKVFVDSDADTRLSRWILRDTSDVSGGESKLESILFTYLNHARPEMNEFIFPTKQFADVILPRGSETTGVQLLATGIYERIKEDAMNLPTHHGVETPKIDLRKESFLEQNQRYYDLI